MEAEAVASAALALVGGDGGVRVVARICPPAAATATTAPATVGTSFFQDAAVRGRRGAGAVLSFTPAAAAAAPPTSTLSSSSQGRAAAGQRKKEHRLDWCYLQDETNHHVFLHELHPLLAHHLHTSTTTTTGSSNACVVACGAAAAKDHLFKGSQDQPGLVTIAMEEILQFANAVQALNTNQSFVPYRQSKVTRILQDSLCKTSGAVVIACLEEVSCQNAVSTLSLAAHPSQEPNEQCRRSVSVTSFKRAGVNSSAVAKSSSRPILSSMHQPNPVAEKQDRPQWNMSAVKATANKR